SRSPPPKRAICSPASSGLLPPRLPCSVIGRAGGAPTSIGLAITIAAVANTPRQRDAPLLLGSLPASAAPDCPGLPGPLSQPPAPVSAALPSLPAALLALPQTLNALHAQVTALQQQVADLTHLLQPHIHPPAPAPQAKAAQQTPKPAAAAPRSRRAAAAATTPPRKPIHVLPRVEWASDGHYVVICPKLGVLTLEPDSPAWFAWLARQSSFRFVGQQGRFTAHHEVLRVPHGAWRAHRHIRNHSHNLPLGLTQELTF